MTKKTERHHEDEKIYKKNHKYEKQKDIVMIKKNRKTS